MGEGTTDSLEFVLSNKTAASGPGGTLVLEAVLPQDMQAASRLFVSLILDGGAVMPEIPATGFTGVETLYSWLLENWYIYGRWFITADKLVLYLNAGLATQGTLTITATSTYVYTAVIPEMEPEAYYYVTFIKDGTAVLPAFPEDTATTMEDILVWANLNWQAYGQWHIEDNNLVLTTDTPADITITVTSRLPGGFDFGFSDGFDT